MKKTLSLLVVTILIIATGCSSGKATRTMEVTGYCGCGQCCGWERGSWTYLKLNFWNRYVSEGPRKGKKYTGHTAAGTKPREPQPGFFSTDTIIHPWMIPVRIVFFPWFFLSHDGTIAADTAYYSFGTRMYVPGYGWGVVEDRGGAIKGPRRLDLYFDSHGKALQWGRRQVKVEIKR